MTLPLDGEDRRRLQDAIGILVSPLDYPELDDWRRAVNRSVKRLLHADMASFLYPVSGSPSLFSEEVDASSAQKFPHSAPSLPGNFSVWKRIASLAVFNRTSLFSPYLDEYHRSEYYNDYIVPARAYDATGITITLDDAALEDDGGSGSLVTLLFHHDRVEARPFGDRGLHLLHLLLPALRAGVKTRQRFGEGRDRLGGLLDAFGAALMVCDREGKCVHQTPQLTRLFRADPETGRLRNVMLDMAKVLDCSARPAGRAAPDVEVPASREIRTLRARYRVSGSRVGSGLVGADPVVLVSLECLTPEVISDEELRERFGLTRQGIRVARLLAKGLSNARIAEELRISPHTARHHVEQVKLRLGVSSRAEVGAKLLVATGASP